jgi:hypothetical protein
LLVITVDLSPGGDESRRRTIGSMRIANLSDLTDICDYSVEVVEGANPVTGTKARKAACMVLAHDRKQTLWALLAKASTEITRAAFVEL